MRAGKLRYPVTIERRVDTQDAAGQVTFAYASVGSDFAAIEDVINRESVAGVQVTADTTTRIRMRPRDDIQIDETCRIRHARISGSPDEDAVYDILGPPMTDAKSGRRELILNCVLRRAEGWRRGE